MSTARPAQGRRPSPAQIVQGSTRPKKALHTTRSSSTRGKNPHAPLVERWFQKRPCLTTRSSTPLKELSKGPRTLLPKPKGGRELLLSLLYSWPRGRLLQGRRVVLQSLPLQRSRSLQEGREHKQQYCREVNSLLLWFSGLFMKLFNFAVNT